MRRSWLLWVAAVLAGVSLVVAACGGSPAAPSGDAPAGSGAPAPAETGSIASSAPSAASPEPSAAPTEPPAASASAAGGTLPAECAEGFAAYLTAIEPAAADFDPANATLADLGAVADHVQTRSIELLTENDSRATYDCSAVGLQWAYFDAASPWDVVLPYAAEVAPGTVGYLTAVRDLSTVDVATLDDLGVDGCDDAVERIRTQVAEQTSAGTGGVAEMSIADGIALYSLYSAYLADVRSGACPADVLGNEEFGFFSGVR